MQAAPKVPCHQLTPATYLSWAAKEPTIWEEKTPRSLGLGKLYLYKDHILPMQKLTVEAGHLLKELQWQQKCRVRSSKAFLQRECLCFPGRQLREKGGILGDMRSPMGRQNPQVASTLPRMGS